jgi:glycosyltransferase involved in cell wall biosynthesis
MARSAIAAGYEVTVYARWHPGLPPTEERDGYRLIRVPYEWQLAVPGLRARARRRAAAAMAAAAADYAAMAQAPAAPTAVSFWVDPTDDGSTSGDGGARLDDDPAAVETGPPPVAAGGLSRAVSLPRRTAGRVKRRTLAPWKRWWRLVKIFPLRPLAWAASLELVAEPADIWHGMWAGSLPALTRLQRRHGGRTIYDSRDIYMRSRDFESAGQPGKRVLEWLERRWARATDRVLTVNDSYADLLIDQLRIERPPVVMNCPEAWQPPRPRPDLIRERLGLPPGIRVVLYQGQLISGRGIEQAMEAILLVPDAVLVLLGHGSWTDRFTRQVAEAPFIGRVAMLPSVPPEALLWWTASADVTVMAIQPTSLNHRFTTPQKLFESIAAGVPVVASDLPGMAGIVRGSDVGLVCDPSEPADIAAAIRSLLAEPIDAQEARRRHILRLAHDRYNWERQWARLDALYREIAPVDGPLAAGGGVDRD